MKFQLGYIIFHRALTLHRSFLETQEERSKERPKPPTRRLVLQPLGLLQTAEWQDVVPLDDYFFFASSKEIVGFPLSSSLLK